MRALAVRARRCLRPFALIAMHTVRRMLLVVVIAAPMALAPVVADGQELPERDLGKPAAVAGQFKSIAAVRELRDGRVLVVDAVEPRLLLADFASGKSEVKQKSGTDDDDARSFGPLWAWPGDSTASLDAARGRLMIFGPDGALARTTKLGPTHAGAPGSAPASRIPTLRYLVGTETVIGIGFSPRPPAPPTPASPPPRVPYPVIRFSLRTMRADTIAQLMPAQAPRAPIQPNGWGSGTYTVYVGTAPLQSVDVWAALADGTVAVVRAASYRIEWHAPDGTRSSADPVPFTATAVTGADRKRVIEDFKRESDATLQKNSMRTAALAINYDEPSSWPSTHPPFRSDIAPQVDGKDRLWLATRCLKDEQSICYDVIDRQGVRVARYRLPSRTIVVGFGADALYAFNQQKGLLQRHPLNDAP